VRHSKHSTWPLIRAESYPGRPTWAMQVRAMHVLHMAVVVLKGEDSVLSAHRVPV